MQTLGCNECKKELPVDSFNLCKGITRGYQYKCKSCMKNINKAEAVQAKKREAIKGWRKSNPDKVAEQKKRHYEKYKEKARERSRKHYAENKDQHRNSTMLRKYGITLEEYDKSRQAQNYRCALCGKHEDNNKQGLVIDHCHKSTEVRKLLCTSCNVGLGMFKDNIDLLAKAMEYLKEHRE